MSHPCIEATDTRRPKATLIRSQQLGPGPAKISRTVCAIWRKKPSAPQTDFIIISFVVTRTWILSRNPEVIDCIAQFVRLMQFVFRVHTSDWVYCVFERNLLSFFRGLRKKNGLLREENCLGLKRRKFSDLNFSATFLIFTSSDD